MHKREYRLCLAHTINTFVT